jgi:sigma-B regulation protein RsbU (phosphoserine phosphatase)
MKAPIKLTIPSESKYLRLARETLKQYLDCQKIADELSFKLILCVDEACSNVIKYGYGGSPGQPIELCFDFEDDEFVATIRDYGNQCDAEKIKPRPLDEIRPGGLGTFFIFQIMDAVDYCTNREKGTLLTMSKKLDQKCSSVSQNT